MTDEKFLNENEKVVRKNDKAMRKEEKVLRKPTNSELPTFVSAVEQFHSRLESIAQKCGDTPLGGAVWSILYRAALQKRKSPLLTDIETLGEAARRKYIETKPDPIGEIYGRISACCRDIMVHYSLLMMGKNLRLSSRTDERSSRALRRFCDILIIDIKDVVINLNITINNFGGGDGDKNGGGNDGGDGRRYVALLIRRIRRNRFPHDSYTKVGTFIRTLEDKNDKNFEEADKAQHICQRLADSKPNPNAKSLDAVWHTCIKYASDPNYPYDNGSPKKGKRNSPPAPSPFPKGWR